VNGIGHFVRIIGDLHYKRTEKFPHYMTVSSIENLPQKPLDFSLASLRGLAPDAFGKLSSTEYVDKVRDGDW
jgi:hypothetical protein